MIVTKRRKFDLNILKTGDSSQVVPELEKLVARIFQK